MNKQTRVWIPELSFSKKDFRVDTFRSGGKGGQHQNTTDSGVRITHIESGLSAESRSSRSQKQNRDIAFNRLAKLIKVKIITPAMEVERNRAGNELIRTYNEATDMIRDERSNKTFSYKKTFKKGKYPFLD